MADGLTSQKSESTVRARANWVWATVLLAVTGRIAIEAASHFTNEDFFITLRYAENIARGSGFVFNSGERVLGTTTPLFTLFLAACTRLGLPAISAAKVIGIASDAGLCLVVYRLLAGAGYERAGRLATFIVAIHPLHLKWSISGMETSLVTLLCMTVWLAYAERRYFAAYALLGVLFLLRWDSVLLVAVVTIGMVARERRVPWRELSVFAAIIVPWIVFAWFYFGSPIPVTGFAKLTVYGWRLRNELFPHLPKYLYKFVGTVPYALMTLGACVGLRVFWRDRKSQFAPMLGWFVLYVGLLATSRILVFEWYAVPPWPVYEMVAAVGLFTAWESRPKGWSPNISRSILMVAVTVLSMGCIVGTAQSCRQTQSLEENHRIPIGRWLKVHVGQNGRIMLEPIGYIGYYSESRVLDIVGLVSPEVLSSYRRDVPSPVLDIVRRFRPEWALLRPGELQHVLDAGRSEWELHYVLVKTFAPPPTSTFKADTFYLFQRR